MGDFVAVEDGEVGVAGVDEAKGVFDVFGGFFERVGGLSADVDLLDLERIGGFFQFFGVDEKGIVEVKVVEVDGVVDFGEDADDEEFSSEESDGFSDWFGGSVERGGEVGADDGDGGFRGVGEERAGF